MLLSDLARTRGTRRRAERACRVKLDELNLPTPFRWGAVVDLIEQRRGRELWVKDSSVLPPEITGLWVGCVTRDYVFYRGNLDDCRRETTILHEFAHIICEHRSAHIADEAWLEQHCPWVAGMGDVEHVCVRADYATADEQEAELMATLILARAAGGGRLSGAGSAEEELSARHRVESLWQTWTGNRSRREAGGKIAGIILPGIYAATGLRLLALVKDTDDPGVREIGVAVGAVAAASSSLAPMALRTVDAVAGDANYARFFSQVATATAAGYGRAVMLRSVHPADEAAARIQSRRRQLLATLAVMGVLFRP